MPLLTPAETGLTDVVLATAEAIVAAELGATQLGQRVVSESGTVGNSGLITPRDGPVTGVNNLTLNGVPVTVALQSSWSIDVRGALGGGYGSGLGGFGGFTAVPYLLNYTAGWTVATLPPQVKQAILMTGAALVARPDPTVRSETVGPESRSWSTDAAGVPVLARGLLDSWRGLRF